jgi:hypothetical protein
LKIKNLNFIKAEYMLRFAGISKKIQNHLERFAIINKQEGVPHGNYQDEGKT